MVDRNREFLNFIVDVGPHMHSLLPHVAEYLLCSTEAKLLNKPSHEVALVLYGSTETKNDIAQEMGEGGDQYLHISVRQPYKLPSYQDLKLFRELPPGQGYSDILDALAVAGDMMVKCDSERMLLGKSARRIVLISNFNAKGKGWDDEFKEQLITTFKTHNIRLDVIHLDFDPTASTVPAAGQHSTLDGGAVSSAASTQLPLAQATPNLTPEEQAIQSENLDQVTSMLQELGGKEPRHIQSAADLAMAVRWSDVSPTTLYQGPFNIGKTLKIPVKVYKKIKKETLPSLKAFARTVAPKQPMADDEGAIDLTTGADDERGGDGGGGGDEGAIDLTTGADDERGGDGGGGGDERAIDLTTGADDERGGDGGGGGDGTAGEQSHAASYLSQVVRARQYHVEGEPDVKVEEDDTIRGHRYGQQAIAVPEDVETTLMKYSVAHKGLWLWGFMPADQVTRFSLMSESLVLVPGADKGAAEAVSALVRVMQQEGQVAVARFVARANSRPRLVLLSPWLGNMRRPDAWVGNYLPFEQDIKWVDFPPLGKGVPLKEEQLAAAEQLLDSMQLAGPTVGRELLAPDFTPNPVMRRFYLSVANRCLDGDAAQVPDYESDHLAKAVFEPPTTLLAAAQEVQKQFKETFPTEVVVKKEEAVAVEEEGQRAKLAFDLDPAAAATAGGSGDGTQHGGAAGGEGRLVVTISTATPVDDFQHLITTPANVQPAVDAMREVVVQLIDDSVSSRNYDKAASCVATLRRACVEHRLPAHFNEHLKDLVTRYKSHEAHSAFVTRLIAAGVSLISLAELDLTGGREAAAEGAVSQQESEAFLKQHAPAAGQQGGDGEQVEEQQVQDDFADMD